MNVNVELKEEKALVELAGGVTSVARRAGVSAGNLSGYLRGRPQLSEALVARLMAEVGLPNRRPDPERVHYWRVGSAKEAASASIARLQAVLPLFFPGGAEIAEVSTNRSLHLNVFRRLGLRIYALRGRQDPVIRAVVLRPTIRGLVQVGPELGPKVLESVTWKDEKENAVIDVPDPTAWEQRRIDVAAFDACWNGSSPAAIGETVIRETAEDWDAVRVRAEEAGLSPMDLLALIDRRRKN